MFELYKNAAATVPSASTDRVRLFVDTDGLPKIKDDTGAVTSLKGDPGEGIAVGGTTGQVLAKASATDYDTAWVDQAGAIITSVNGQTGVVVLDAADVGAEPADATILKDADIGVTVQGYSAVLAGTTASFTTADETKLDGIEAGAEVNVNADWNAVSGDAQILNKPTLGTAAAAATTDFATAAQGTKADSALQAADIGVTVQGYSAVLAGTTASFTTADETKLDGIAAGAEVNVNADWNATSGDAEILNKPTLGTAAATDSTDYATAAQGALADSALQAADIGVTVQGYSAVLAGTTASFTTADETKLDGIEAGADVTDAANVEPLVDDHLNTATATTDQVLSWNGTDYDWVDQSGGGGGGGALTISNKTAAYTVVAGDLGTIINCTSGTFTVSLTAAATLGAGFNCWIWNTSTTSTHLITIDPNGTETIDGASTIVLSPGQGFNIVCTGTSFIAGDQKTLRMYAENQNSTLRATATGANAVSIGDSASASGSSGMVFGSYSTASGANSLALGRSTTSSGTSATAIGFGPLASSTYAFAAGTHSGGFASRAVTGTSAMALGGSYASGTDSFAAAVANNTSTYGAIGVNAIAMGRQAKANGIRAISISADTGVASSSDAVAIGSGVTASGLAATVFGYASTASGANSSAFGAYALAGTIGKIALSGGCINNSGDAQLGYFVLRRATTDATATTLNAGTGNPASSTTNQLILPNNSAYAFTGTVVARRQAAGGTESAAWKVEGLIRREGTAATTTLVASTVTAIDNTPGWTLALSADTTNGGLAVTATGAAATNIRWVATIQTSEVTYA